MKYSIITEENYLWFNSSVKFSACVNGEPVPEVISSPRGGDRSYRLGQPLCGPASLMGCRPRLRASVLKRSMDRSTVAPRKGTFGIRYLLFEGRDDDI